MNENGSPYIVLEDSYKGNTRTIHGKINMLVNKSYHIYQDYNLNHAINTSITINYQSSNI